MRVAAPALSKPGPSPLPLHSVGVTMVEPAAYSKRYSMHILPLVVKVFCIIAALVPTYFAYPRHPLHAHLDTPPY